MRQFTAVIKHDKGLVTKYQDFDDKATAEAFVLKHNGVKVVEGLDNIFEYWDVSGDTPVQNTDKQAADATARAALAEIHRLEAQVTNRRLREAFSDSTWLDAQEALIAIERAKL